MSTPRTTTEINEDIQRIFRRYNITPVPGEEGFWEAVDEVYFLDTTVGDQLEDLAEEWTAANMIERAG